MSKNIEDHRTRNNSSCEYWRLRQHVALNITNIPQTEKLNVLVVKSKISEHDSYLCCIPSVSPVWDWKFALFHHIYIATKNILNERKAWLFSTIGKKGKDPLMTLNNKNYHLKTLILNHDIFHLEMLKNHVNSACKAKTRQIIAHKNIINWNKNMYTKL